MNCSHGLKFSGSRINTLNVCVAGFHNHKLLLLELPKVFKLFTSLYVYQRSTFKLVFPMRDFADGAGERETRYIYRWHLATIVTEVIIKINMHIYIYIIIIHQCVYEFCIHIYIHIYIHIFHGIFHNIWDNPSHWLICFKMVETTHQS